MGVERCHRFRVRLDRRGTLCRTSPRRSSSADPAFTAGGARLLGDIAERAAAPAIRAPAVTVVGQVAVLADELGWLAEGELEGTAVVVTRTPAQSSSRASPCESSAPGSWRRRRSRSIRSRPDPGAPTIRPPGADIPNGARLFFDRPAHQRARRAGACGCRVAVVGPGTADAVRRTRHRARRRAGRAVGEGLADALAGLEIDRALIARAQEARAIVPDALRASAPRSTS